MEARIKAVRRCGPGLALRAPAGGEARSAPATSRRGRLPSGRASRCFRVQPALHRVCQLERSVWAPLTRLTEREQHHKTCLEFHPEHIIPWTWRMTQDTRTAGPAFQQEVVKRHRLISRARGCRRRPGPVGLRRVAYLLAADIVSRLPSFRLSDDNQPVIMTRNRFSTPRSSLLACIGAHASRSTPPSSTGILFETVCGCGHGGTR